MDTKAWEGSAEALVIDAATYLALKVTFQYIPKNIPTEDAQLKLCHFGHHGRTVQMLQQKNA